MAKTYKCTLLHDSFGHSKHRPKEPPKGRELVHHVSLKKGTVIEDEDAWVLVRNGHADPADEECLKKAIEGGAALGGMANFPPTTKEALTVAKERFLKQSMGRLTGNPRLDAPDPDAQQESLADAARS